MKPRAPLSVAAFLALSGCADLWGVEGLRAGVDASTDARPSDATADRFEARDAREAGPPACAGASTFLVFGGYTGSTGETAGDTWAWNGAWKAGPTSGPGPRTDAVAGTAGGGVILFGGVVFQPTPHDVADTWSARLDVAARPSLGHVYGVARRPVFPPRPLR